jgi:ubiquinol-cytochrome c reductase cytochrome c1 subunit
MRNVTMRTSLWLAAIPVMALLASPAVASEAAHIEREEWSFAGFKGRYDKNQLQRGFQVYQNVCSACHSLNRIYFRNLVQPGGPEFPEEAVKALAAEWPNQIPETNDVGESAVTTKDKDGKTNGFKLIKRAPGLPDPILGPFANEKVARANFGGALPPDLSVIAKARNVEYHGSWMGHPASMLKDIVKGYQEGGPDYIHALLTHYKDLPPAYLRDDKGKLVAASDADAADKSKKAERCISVAAGEEGKPDTCNKLGDGMNYNTVFPGGQIAMSPPLADGVVAYGPGGDGSAAAPATADQYARDVAAFLAWTADPSLNSRKSIGLSVMLYLLVTTVLLYLGKKRIWSRIEH